MISLPYFQDSEFGGNYRQGLRSLGMVAWGEECGREDVYPSGAEALFFCDVDVRAEARTLHGGEDAGSSAVHPGNEELFREAPVRLLASE